MHSTRNASSKRRRLLICRVLPATIALAALTWATGAEAGTRYGRFSFERDTNLISLPVSGPRAPWTVAREDLNVAFVEVAERDARALDLAPRSRDNASELVKRILVAENRQGVLRVAVRGTRPVDLVPAYRRLGGKWFLQIRVVPRTADELAGQTGPERDARTILTSTRYDALTDTLWVGFRGVPPVYRVTRLADPRRFHAAFKGAAAPSVLAGTVRAPGSWLARWELRMLGNGEARLVLMPTPPQPLTVHSERKGSYVVFSRAATVPAPLATLAPSPGPELRPAAQPAPRPMHTPSARLASTPEPTPEPSPSPTPLPSPSPVVVRPAPVAPAPVPARGMGALDLPSPELSTSISRISESFGPESQAFTRDGVVGLRVDWAPTWQDWRFPLAFGQTGYQFTNADYPGVVHRREVSHGLVAIERQYRLGGLDLASGLGYEGSWARVTSNAGAPTPPAPSRMWFSPAMNLSGVTLRQDVVLRAANGVTFGLTLALAPVVFTDVSLTNAMPGLSRFRLAPSLAFGPERLVKLSLFYDQVLGGDFRTDANGVSGAFTQAAFGAGLSFGLGKFDTQGGDR